MSKFAKLVGLSLSISALIVLTIIGCEKGGGSSGGDTKPPVINHTPVTTGTSGTPITISAIITDDKSGVKSASLFYKKGEGASANSEPFKEKNMTAVGGDQYTATIPGEEVTTAGLEYYIEAKDNQGNTAKTTIYTINVPNGGSKPPTTTILSGPENGGKYKQTTFTFTWTGQDDTTPTSELTYRITPDTQDPSKTVVTSQTSWKFTDLVSGRHQFSVAAIDKEGNIDPNPPKRTFYVDTIPPTVTIIGGPEAGAIIAYNTLSFTWTGSDNLTPTSKLLYYTQLDGGDWSKPLPDTSMQLEGLSDGRHDFAVAARDEVGNVSPSVWRSFYVDTTPPETDLTMFPPAISNVATEVRFEWSGRDNVSDAADLRYFYKLDVDTSPGYVKETAITYPEVSEGQHKFSVRAIDQAGNEEQTPAEWTFVIDTTPPQTTLDMSKTSTEVIFTWYGQDNLSDPEEIAFSYKLDGQSWSPFTTNTTKKYFLSSLTKGTHTFSVMARDSAGNTEQPPVSITFTVD